MPFACNPQYCKWKQIASKHFLKFQALQVNLFLNEPFHFLKNETVNFDVHELRKLTHKTGVMSLNFWFSWTNSVTPRDVKFALDLTEKSNKYSQLRYKNLAFKWPDWLLVTTLICATWLTSDVMYDMDARWTHIRYSHKNTAAYSDSYFMLFQISMNVSCTPVSVKNQQNASTRRGCTSASVPWVLGIAMLPRPAMVRPQEIFPVYPPVYKIIWSKPVFGRYIFNFLFPADINECASNICDGICINTKGSYECHCDGRRGLRMAENNNYCERIPVCLDLQDYKHSEMLYLGEQFTGLPVIFLRFRLPENTKWESVTNTWNVLLFLKDWWLSAVTFELVHLDDGINSYLCVAGRQICSRVWLPYVWPRGSCPVCRVLPGLMVHVGAKRWSNWGPVQKPAHIQGHQWRKSH